jgi:hypothetical protein
MAESEKIFADKQFVALVKAVEENKVKVATVNGALGERVKAAVDNANLHLGAFKLICKLYHFEEEKRAEFLRQFDLYREKAVRLQLFGPEHVGDLMDQAGESGEAAQQYAEDPQHVGADGVYADPDLEAAAHNAALLSGGISEIPAQEGEFDDASAANPSMRNRRPRRGMEGGDAPGNYKVS